MPQVRRPAVAVLPESNQRCLVGYPLPPATAGCGRCPKDPAPSGHPWAQLGKGKGLVHLGRPAYSGSVTVADPERQTADCVLALLFLNRSWRLQTPP
jgi:hypothetical protein